MSGRAVSRCANLVRGLALLGIVGGLLLGGAADAEACQPPGSGPPRPEGLTSFNVSRTPNGGRVSVANNGFFAVVLRGNLGSIPRLSLVTAEVKTKQGVVVPGGLHAFPRDTGSIYWLADSELADGEYVVTIDAPSLPAGSQVVHLDVSGAPTPLTLPTIEPREWLTYHRLSAGSLTCSAPGACEQVRFGETEERTPGVDLSITAPAINGQVAWFVTVALAGTPPASPSCAGPCAWISDSGDIGSGSGLLDLKANQAEYCFVTTVRDERDDSELRSEPQCFSPSAPREVDETSVLLDCDAPPAPSLLPLWCKWHLHDARCKGPPFDDVGAAAGAGGANGVISGRAGSGSVDHPVDTNAVDGTSSACSVGHAGRNSGLAAAALLALAAFGVRRRANRA